MRSKILIIDDDRDFLEDLSLLLAKDYQVATAQSEGSGLQAIREDPPEIVLLDLMLESSSGLDVLTKIRTEDPGIPVIMITDHGSIETAVKAIRLGATDYISKTPKMSELDLIIERALKQRQLQYQIQVLKANQSDAYKEMIGTSRIMQDLRHQINLLSDNSFPVLITGESGTGKELVAYQIHSRSNRVSRPFVSLNCAAIPKNLLESELFGHEKGAFTGASQRKPGKFEVAEGGILFLDEIGDLDLDSQVKLLRVIQEKEFTRIGSNTVINADVRVVAATNQNLEQLVEKGTFREDLYYRLDVLQVDVPPLRERKADIPALAEHFLKLAALDAKIAPKPIHEDAIQALISYAWPGNIRELRNIISRAILLSEGPEILSDDLTLPKASRRNSEIKIDLNLESLEKARKKASAEAKRAVEASFVERLLAAHDNNVSQAARELGINRASLHKMITRIRKGGN